MKLVRLFQIILVVLMVILGTGAVSAMISMIRYESTLRAVARDNIGFTSSQGINEFRRFQLAVSQYSCRSPDADKDSVLERYEILQARLETYRGTMIKKFLDRKPRYRETVSDFDQTLKDIDPLMKKIDDKGVAARILDRTDSFAPELLKFAAGAFQFEAIKVSEDEGKLLTLHWIFASFAGALVLCCVLLAGVLFWQNRIIAEKTRMDGEIATAKKVQDTLFPPSFAKLDDVTICGHYEPATECGGDWWHYFDTPEHTYLWIGDATGHGVGAALLTSAACATVAIMSRLPDVSPAGALAHLDRAIRATSNGQLNMTFFVGVIDKKTKMLTYSNAGHTSPIIIGEKALKQGNLTLKDLKFLTKARGPVLGDGTDKTFPEAQVQLNPGDLIFCYTDGLLDLKGQGGDNWGRKSMVAALISAALDAAEPDAIKARMLETIDEFRSGFALEDDVTFFVSKLT